MAEPLRICITGAAGQIAYSLLYSVAKGDVFGANTSDGELLPAMPLILHLLDIPPMMTALNGVVMELQDCALPLLHGVVATADAKEAFTNIDVVLMVGAMPRREGMERKDLLEANAKIFVTQGKILDEVAKKTVKVLVVGNPANTNCYITHKMAPSIPVENFSCLTRLDQNRATAQIAARLGIKIDEVKNAIIWGNHSSTQYPDVNHGKAVINGAEVPIREAVKDDDYLNGDFIKTVQKRGAAIISARKLSSAMSAAKAICDHMRDWWFGTAPNHWVSMGVVSDGSYGIPEGIVYSFPVEIDSNSKWTIVQGLSISDFSREKMDLTAKELLEEQSAVSSFLTN